MKIVKNAHLGVVAKRDEICVCFAKAFQNLRDRMTEVVSYEAVWQDKEKTNQGHFKIFNISNTAHCDVFNRGIFKICLALKYWWGRPALRVGPAPEN